MEPFAASTTAKRRAEERNTCVCFSAGLFSVILKMFLLTASHLETKHVEAVQAGDVVVMLGSSAILPCHIITNDRLSQITWQKTIKGKAPNDVFLTIQPKIGLVYSNGKDSRFEFNGNFSDKNGTLKFSNVTLEDEGSYTCIFSLFPGGTQSRNSQLVILVPPITNLMDHTPLEGNEEVPLATCTAAASKPKAEVRWIKGSLEGKVREKLNETQHANGTTTTWSTLLGKPGREMKGQLVKCVISNEATKEEILQTNIQVHSVQVGDVVVMFGSSAILPCHIITNDRLFQITWQRTIKGKAPNDRFLAINERSELKYSNKNNKSNFRFEFIGNFDNKDGTLKFYNVTLEDEGLYRCIFSLLPSGNKHSKGSQLEILVPPITNLMDYTPLEENEEVPLATCTAAASKPKAEVRWIKGSLEEKVREEFKETKHANGTTTTWSTLLGKPGREMKGQLVKCVISSEATKEEILETNIQVHYPPGKVNIVERSEVSFECETEANPKATVIWTRSGQPLPTSVKVVGATLQFSSQSNEMSGLYQCETTNPYGSKQTYLFVHFSSGNCTGPIIIAVFSTLLILLILAIIGLYYCHRTGKLQRFSDLWGEMRQQVQRRDPPAADTEEGLSPAETVADGSSKSPAEAVADGSSKSPAEAVAEGSSGL